jgi:hypothetical protein
MSRYVIIFNGKSDPPRAEMRSLASELAKSVQVVDQMPGVILVDGPEAIIAPVVASRPDWTYAPEGTATTGKRRLGRVVPL